MTGVEEAEAQWRAEGLPFPVVPDSLVPSFHRLGPWSFGTRDDAPGAYALDEHLRPVLEGVVPDSALLAHAGHGIASWAMHWYVTLGPVAIFVQSQWGNADASEDDDREQRDHMRHRFDAATSLTAHAVEALTGTTRLLVVASDFRRSGWGILEPGATERWTESADPFADAEAWLATVR